MLLGKFKGRQVHFYQLDGCEFYVVRGQPLRRGLVPG